MDHLSLSLIDLIILMLGAVCLGITIHFFIVSKRNLRNSTAPDDKNNKIAEQWKARYFNDVESKEKELTTLRKKLEESEQNHSIYAIEAEELRRENKRLVAELDSLKKSMPVQNAPNFMGQLKLAQESFLEQNERIGQLLDQIEIVKENENKRDEVLIENEELSNQVEELKRLLSEKEKEIGNSSQKQSLASEMSSMLDDAYQDFDDLQEKIRSLESQITTSKINNLDYESLKEEHYKLREEFETNRVKLNGATLQNQQFQLQLTETENKLREANFQRQQLQKRVSYLEELAKDIQLVAEANKKLQTQLSRLGELESMLNVISEERNELMRRQMNAS